MSTATKVYTQDEYIEELQRRQAEYEEQHPSNPRVPWLRPLLEWFIREDDQVLGVTA